MPAQSFTDLDVWKTAHKAVLAVYKLTRSFPSDERFCLTQQMRKCAASIPANIAEGFGRRAPRDKAHFYIMGRGSLEELRYYLILSRDLGYAKETKEVDGHLDDCARMLNRLYTVTLERV